MKHSIQSHLLQRRVMVHVVGCGGTGSQVLTGLARLHLAMLSLGHPSGMHVKAYDFDEVTDANVGRQLFSPSDVGQMKSSVLVHRLNAFFGLDWEDKPFRYRYEQDSPDIIILCLDSRKSRHECRKVIEKLPLGCYVMDCGNEASTGQVIIGGNGMKLPWELYPSLTDLRRKESDTPSCSLAEALESQELFINQAVATYALNTLWMLFRNGGLDNQGVFINLKSGNTRPIIVAPSQNPLCKSR